jgi:hypothetical protein
LPADSCGAEASTDTDEIQSALLYAELDRAETLASAAIAWAPCADLAAPDLSDLLRIWGIVAVHQEGPAAERFAIARSMFPEMVWDDRFAPRYREAFDAYEAAFEQTELTVFPPGDLRIDGTQSTDTTLSAGRHVVTLGSNGAWVTLLDAPDTLVLPAAYPDDALSWMADETLRPALTELLAVTLGEGERAMVHHDGTVWTGTTGRVDWQALPSLLPTEAPPLPQAKSRPTGPILAISGGGLALVGIGLAAGGYAMASSNADQNPSTTGAVRSKRYLMGRTLSQVGLGIGIAGGVVSGTGVAFTVAGAP